MKYFELLPLQLRPWKIGAIFLSVKKLWIHPLIDITSKRFRHNKLDVTKGATSKHSTFEGNA